MLRTLLLLLLLAAAPLVARADEKNADDAMCHAQVPLLSTATTLATMRAAAQYRAIVARGGWAQLPLQPSLQPGDVHPNVRLLRQRLRAEGDLAAANASPRFDAPLAAALERFQGRYGLPVTGILDRNTIATLNVPAAERLQQIETSLAQLRSEVHNAAASPRSVTVNIPAAQVEAVENGKVAGQYRAAAGAPDRPSPELEARIVAVNFHPGWTVPPGIIKRDLIPKMQADPGYLTRNGYVVSDARGRKVDPARLNWHGTEPLRYTYRLPAGDHNPMGDIRLNLPNAESVYMHDTPKRGLFNRSIRFLSSGCVRVDGIEKLTAWLLGWSDTRVARTVAHPAQTNVALATPVPVRWVYVTAWSTPNHVTCFRPDIYSKVPPLTALNN